MRLGDGGKATAAVAVVGVLLVMVDSATAKPNFLPAGQRPEERMVEVSQTSSAVEQECPSSILYKWLEEQEPWHILGNLKEEEGLEVQSEDNPFPEVQFQNLGDNDLVAQHQEEQEEGEEVEGTGASTDADDIITSPVSLEILGGSEDDLLNPGKDYEVFVLSDTADTARILLVLDAHLEMSTCGVGGFIKVEDNEDLGSNYALPVSALSTGPGADYAQDPSYVPPEEGMNSTITVGECFWWAEGVLVGGDEVSVEYTPPECGCVMLSVYAAFDIENRTLISGPNPKMGPQSKLLCVDRTSPVDPEGEHLVQLQDALPVSQNATNVDAQPNDLTDDPNSDDEGKVTPQPVESKEKRRITWRQRIRRNRRRRGRCTKRNWWMCRKNRVAKLNRGRGGLQKEKENEDGGSEDENENNTQAYRKNHGKVWKKKRQHHKRRKGWRKNHRQHRARKANPNKCTRWRRRRGLCNVTEVPEVQDEEVDTSNETESSLEPGAELRNQIHVEDENEDLFTLLLGPEEDYETTLLQGKQGYHEEQEQEEQEEQQEPLEDEEGGRRGGRKLNPKPLMNQRKMRRMLPAGKKFCCKQGVAKKKTTAQTTATTTSPIEDILLMTPAHEDQQEEQDAQKVQEDDGEEEKEKFCLGAPQEVTTWAYYKFQIDPSECEMVYKTCCSNFDVEWWLQARQRKLERKERRKKNFQQKREKKKGRRQQKKTERKAKLGEKKSRWEARKAKWNTKEKGQVEE